MIKIDLTEEEASLFKIFREQQDNFFVIKEAGVFNIRSGKAVLHFNIEGILDSIDVDVPLFKRGHKQIQFLSSK